MERPRFDQFANIKVTQEVTDKFKKMNERTPKQIEGMNYLQVLQSKHVYAGTANPRKVAKRRVKNKMAGQSRKKNRKAA